MALYYTFPPTGSLEDWDFAVQKTETRLNRINEQRAKVGAVLHRPGVSFGCLWLMLPCSDHLLGSWERSQPGSARGRESWAAAESQGRKEGSEEGPEGNASWGEEESRTGRLSRWMEWGRRWNRLLSWWTNSFFLTKTKCDSNFLFLCDITRS